MKAFKIKFGIWVDKENIDSIAVFNKLFMKAGNLANPEKTNDIDQLYVSFTVVTDNALEWLYKWIHEYMLDGQINHDRDTEIKYITGNNEFIKAVYKVIFKKDFSEKVNNIHNVKNL